LRQDNEGEKLTKNSVLNKTRSGQKAKIAKPKRVMASEITMLTADDSLDRASMAA
jgi:hypothetical protein